MKWPSRRFWILFLPICVGIILVRLYYSGDEGINEVAPITYPKVKTVLLIPGIISQEWMWGDWKKEMTALFPDAKVQMHQKFYYCVPTRPVQDFVTEIEQAVEITEEPVFILAHSFGGLVAKKAIENSDKEIYLLTLGTPHGASWVTKLGGCEYAKRTLSIPQESENIIGTFGGSRDHMVFDSIARHLKTPHQTLKVMHTGFLLSKEARSTILQTIPELLTPSSAPVQ